MAAEGNMTIARPSTPASYFHLLRRQAYSQPQRPLIVFTPKAMLRLRGATSSVEDFTTGTFEPVLDDHSVEKKARRVVLHSGKIYYDLLAEREKRGLPDVALVRLEQFYPFPESQIRAVLDRHPGVDIVWAQDEPENQGAWPFISVELRRLGMTDVRVVSRPASASPAAGSSKRSAEEHAVVMDGVFHGL
jgi:2-oxoglutarate dehydrogenase E1 component